MGMTESFVYDYGQKSQRICGEEETFHILQEINHEFIKDNKARQYKHMVRTILLYLHLRIIE